LERIFRPAARADVRADVSPGARKPLKSLGREMHEFRGIVSFQRLGPDFGSLFLSLGASLRRFRQDRSAGFDRFGDRTRYFPRKQVFASFLIY
jgi:hypothetical protein